MPKKGNTKRKDNKVKHPKKLKKDSTKEANDDEKLHKNKKMGVGNQLNESNEKNKIKEEHNSESGSDNTTSHESDISTSLESPTRRRRSLIVSLMRSQIVHLMKSDSASDEESGSSSSSDTTNHETKESDKEKDDTSKIIDLAGKAIPVVGATLEDIRTMYDNSKLWLAEEDSEELIFLPTYKLHPGKVYKVHLPSNTTAKKTGVRTKEQICKTLEDIPSASTYAAPNIAGCWRRNAGIAECMKVHRSNSGTPVVLLDPVLSDLYDDIVYKKYTPISRDCIAAVKLMEALSCGFGSEPSMQSFINRWAAESLEWPLVRVGNADGTWIVGDCLLLNLELNNEKGTGGGGSSYIKNIGYYAHHWAPESRKAIWKKSICPAILIEITGPEIAVSGAVLVDEQGVLCDPFFTTSLLFNIYDYNHLSSVALILGAVTKAANRLVSYYQKFDIPFDGFPFLRSISQAELLHRESLIPMSTEDEEVSINIVYKRKIKELLYLAELKIGESSIKQVVVKFTHSYSEEAHKVCESAGCAPALYFVGQVSRFRVVIMEWIENAEHWHAVKSGKQKQSAKKTIKRAIAQLHKHKLVHGDLRSTNILLSGSRVALIDFDWSGSPPHTYPLFINQEDINWPVGVGDGKPLAFEHDEEWISRDFK